MTNSRQSATRQLYVAAAFLVLGGVAVAAPSTSGTKSPGAATIDADFRAAYPMTAPPSASTLAGVELGKLAIPGLRKTAADERAADDGGLVWSYSDMTGKVAVLVHVAVTPDTATARQLLDIELHGISTLVPKAIDPALGDLAFADDGGKGTSLVIATRANVEYSVDVVSDAPGIPTAAAIAGQIGTLMVAGTPIFPSATVTLPPTIDAKKGDDVRISVPGAQPYKVRADGGYMAHGTAWPIIRPFGPGPVTVYATVVDDLARVTIARATTHAE